MGCLTLDPAGVELDANVFIGAQQLLDCLQGQLLDTVGGAACQACLYPGVAVPMDYCGAGSDCASGHGMAAVRVAQMSPEVDASRGNCVFGGRVLVTYEMAVYRCAAVVQNVNGKPVLPSCDELASDTAIVIDDAAAMRRALRCCFMTPPASGGFAPQLLGVGPWTPRGPTGGCVGGSMNFTVAMRDCPC